MLRKSLVLGGFFLFVFCFGFVLFFKTERGVRCWNRLPRQVTGAPFLEMFKDGAPGNLIQYCGRRVNDPNDP